MGKNNKLYLLKQKSAGASKLVPHVGQTLESDRLFKNDSESFVAPNHAILPQLSNENELLYEVQTIVIFVISMCGQYLNLFRTFWWISDTYRRYAMNFHLINSEIVSFCVLAIVKPFVVQLFYRVHYYLPHKIQDVYLNAVISSVHMTFFAFQGMLLYQFALIYPVIDIVKILMPFFLYCLIHQDEIFQFLRFVRRPKTKKREILSSILYLLFPTSFLSCYSVSHLCANFSASLIRDEVDRLRVTVNQRIKFVLFRSVLVAYYGAMIPVFFAPERHEYDPFVTTVQIFSTVVCTFFMLFSHLASPQFFDILHQSSLHLGRWQKLEARNTLVPALAWAESHIYGPGTVVKYAKEYYKSDAYMTTAEPGNQRHVLFFTMFGCTEDSLRSLLKWLFVFVIAQFVILYRTNEWYVLISMSLMILTNSLAVFRLMRTYIILSTIYKQESVSPCQKLD